MLQKTFVLTFVVLNHNLIEVTFHIMIKEVQRQKLRLVTWTVLTVIIFSEIHIHHNKQV